MNKDIEPEDRAFNFFVTFFLILMTLIFLGYYYFGDVKPQPNYTRNQLIDIIRCVANSDDEFEAYCFIKSDVDL